MALFGSYPPVLNVESVSDPPSLTADQVHLLPLLGSQSYFQAFSAHIEESLDKLNKKIEKIGGKKKRKKKKSFLRQVGDAFCKALTPILVSLGTAVIGSIFGPKRSSQSFQRV